jgi:aarF domain-containing kinase
VKRLVNIFHELGPVAIEYIFEFHIRPRFQQSTVASSSLDVRKQLEINLSRKLRSSLTALGPTFVKAGQQLSIRPDLVSPTVLKELQHLCDAVPPFDDTIAMRTLAEELTTSSLVLNRLRNKNSNDNNNIDESEDVGMASIPDINATILSVFEEIPKLVASASLGQVYKATLRSYGDDVIDDNTIAHDNDTQSKLIRTKKEVAIKIQRPDILNTVSLDLYLLVSYGKIMDRLCSILTNQIPYHEHFLNGFAAGAYMEMNYINEAQNQRFFRTELHSRFHGKSTISNNNDKFTNRIGGILSLLLRQGKNDNQIEKVIVPAVYEEFTTERILVTEWIDGTPLARAPPEQIRALIPMGVELFLVQLLDIGRFHADPHPGNLYVTKSRVDGVTPTLCLLDFGLIAHVTEADRSNMTRAILNLLQGDYDALISRDAKDLGFLPSDMDTAEVAPLLKKILKEGLLESGSNLHDRKRNLMAISNELNEVFFRYPFSVPPFFALVTRGLGLLEGIALTGDPSFDIFQASYPYAKRRAIETFSVTDYTKISRNMLRRASTDDM